MLNVSVKPVDTKKKSSNKIPKPKQFKRNIALIPFTTDINECNDNAHDCHSDASCSNTVGSFTCSCNQGYSGDGRQCVGMFMKRFFYFYKI